MRWVRGGPWGGYFTGTAILLEYALAPAAIAVFIDGYVDALIGIDGWIVLASYAAFVGVHLWGAGEALKTMFVTTALAVLAIVVFAVGMLPYFDASNLFDVAVNEQALGASAFLPEGLVGVWAAFPFAIWLFLAVEGVPLAAEEAVDPARDVPRGIVVAVLVLMVFGALVLVPAPAGAGADFMKDHTAPLVGALQAVHGHDSLAATVVNWVGLSGLIASFFSIIYAYSRQAFALSRAGYLPRALSITSARKVSVLALVVPGIFGFLLSLTGEGDLILTMAVFGATVSYALMTLSHMILRRTAPELARPYRTPGGVFTSGAAFALAILALMSTFLASPDAAFWSAVIYLVAIVYFLLYSRHRLVANAPEEEFDAIALAERELE